ncbi:hypothetical protein RB608_11950 [Nocardioides sp. LHD-245]|uniref:hypothetical protein n=1 Tax=Nocardioides sp. LHD-245 TaxID=3051387 RepID=UPI0027DFBE4A|nr:hypothetical protein [Nocardioides sp. LHD-245]
MSEHALNGTTTPTAVLVVPFRDRGHDPRRAANLDAVRRWWDGAPWPLHVIDDGRTGDAQFNRSAAYNRGAELATAAGAEAIVYTEADMLIPWDQVAGAVDRALAEPGLVVPFTEYRYLSDTDSARVRADEHHVAAAVPESVMGNATSMGAINVVSLASLAAIGRWDEAFEGNWYDDNAMERAFSICCGPRRHIAGPAWHLFHLPGWAGDHLTDADRSATEANQHRWERYQAATTPDQIRALTGEARGQQVP